MAYSGKKALIKVSGTTTAFTGEATTNVGGDNKTYQITDTTKRILDKDVPPSVYSLNGTGAATTGTTTTTIKLTAHGLNTGDAIINTTRSNAFRTVTKVDADTLTVTAITGQVSGDTIAKYPKVTTGYTINTLSGSAIFDTATARTIRISGSYLPMSTAAECKEYSITINGELLDKTAFQSDWVQKIQGLKSAEGSLSRWLDIDTYFIDSLLSGNPVVIEMYAQDTLEPDRIWAIINSNEMSTAVDGLNEEAVSFESTNAMLLSYA